MGQFLIVQGRDEQVREKLFRAGVDHFRRMAGLSPSGELSGGPVSVAKFAKRFGAPAGIVRREGEERWMCGAGTLFYDGAAGAEALGRAAGRPLTPESQQRDLAPADGYFALAFGGGASGEFAIVTDRLGSVHVYAATVGGCAVVSTSSMIVAALAQPEWDPAGCREFLSVGSIYERRTLFRGIEKLPPASVFRFRGGELASESRYWQVGDIMYDAAPVRGDVPALAGALEAAVEAIARNFPRPIMDLTGGFDSRAILGACLRSGRKMDTVVNGPDDLPDVVVSKQIASAFALRHRHQKTALDTPVKTWEAAKDALALTDGEYDVLLYNRVADVHSRLASDYDISLNGSNGEIAKGYWWELLFPFTGRKGHFNDRRIAAGRFAFEGDSGLLAERFDEPLADHFAGIIRRANAPLERHPNTAKLDNVYLTLRMQCWQGRIASATTRIWDCASPFMWLGPMAAALSAPPRRRLRHRMTRRLIEYLDPRLAAIPLAEGYPAMPLRPSTAHLFTPLARDVVRAVTRRARRFLPASAPAAPPPPNPILPLWGLDEVRDVLDPAAMASAGLYRPDALKTLLQNSQAAHFGCTIRFSRVLTLELLARRVRAARLGC